VSKRPICASRVGKAIPPNKKNQKKKKKEVSVEARGRFRSHLEVNKQRHKDERRECKKSNIAPKSWAAESD